MKTVMILGRQAGIGLAELESLYGAENIRSIGSIAAIVDVEVDFARIGGSSKAAELLDVLGTTDWQEVQKHLEYTIPEKLRPLGEGKLRLGISAYGFNVSPQKIIATGLNLKKVIRLAGRSTRLVPNVEPVLNSAQVLHNKLTGTHGWELLVIKDNNKTIIAKTLAEQDIDAYTLRDRGRPMRDARVGMLPPKLAQIIVNLATPMASRSDRQEGDRKTKVLDPFCGTGVVLQEAALMGYGVYGTDLEERMVDYTRQNLHWLTTVTPYEGHDSRFEVADATSYAWPHEYDVVASETYLGRAFTTSPPQDMLEKNRRDCDTIIRKFLKNIYNQTKPGFRLALALPVWNTNESSKFQIPNSKFYHLPLLDSLGALGYNQLKFDHASRINMIYHREGQIVGRELIVLTRK